MRPVSVESVSPTARFVRCHVAVIASDTSRRHLWLVASLAPRPCAQFMSDCRVDHLCEQLTQPVQCSNLTACCIPACCRPVMSAAC